MLARVTLLASALALAVPPRPLGRVSDFAGALAPDARARLDAQLQSYETGERQMAVAIFRSLDGESLEEFSIRLAEAWKLGGRASSDGVLLTVFLDDHALRFEVGYGLEDALPDARCARIIREVMAPRLRAGDLEGALRDGFAEVHRALGGGEATPVERAGDRARELALLIWAAIMVGAAIAFIRRRGGGGGGFWGGFWTGGFWRGGWSGRGSSGRSFSGKGGGFGGGGAGGRW